MKGGTYGRASLDVKLAHGGSVVHGVEAGHLVDAHGRHLEDAGDLVHDRDGGEAVLTLAEVEEGHDGCFFVLGGVALEDLGDDFLVLVGELEGDGGVVVGGVAVLFFLKFSLHSIFIAWGKRGGGETHHHEGVALPPRRHGDGAGLEW